MKVTALSSTIGVVFAALLGAHFVTGCKTAQETALDKRGEVYVADSSKRKNSRNRTSADSTSFQNYGSPVATRNSYSRINTSMPFVAMTFDDGPHPENTPRLLDMLKARDVKATFFVVGTNVKRYPHIARRIVAEGHEIANHTVSHGNLTKMSSAEITKELTIAHQSIQSATGVSPRVMRPPYGAITSSQKSWIKEKFGYPSILWSVDPEDWKKPGVSVVTARLVSGARPGGILLAHDIHKPTIDAMPSTLDQLLRRGFQFVTVSQLIALDGKG